MASIYCSRTVISFRFCHFLLFIATVPFISPFPSSFPRLYLLVSPLPQKPHPHCKFKGKNPSDRSAGTSNCREFELHDSTGAEAMAIDSQLKARPCPLLSCHFFDFLVILFLAKRLLRDSSSSRWGYFFLSLLFHLEGSSGFISPSCDNFQKRSDCWTLKKSVPWKINPHCSFQSSGWSFPCRSIACGVSLDGFFKILF
jgi:hypothetical protein